MNNKSKLLWSLLMALFILTMVSCNGIKEQEIKNDFKKTNPDAVLLEQFVGEGDSDHAYVHFRYTMGNSTEKLEEVWLYQRQQDKKWKVISKEG
jgi:hypothetical protein